MPPSTLHLVQTFVELLVGTSTRYVPSGKWQVDRSCNGCSNHLLPTAECPTHVASIISLLAVLVYTCIPCVYQVRTYIYSIQAAFVLASSASDCVWVQDARSFPRSAASFDLVAITPTCLPGIIFRLFRLVSRQIELGEDREVGTAV